MRPQRTVRASALIAAWLAFDGAAGAANTAAEVCQRWVCDRADMSEGVSTGDVTTCDPGDLLPPGRPNSLKLVNLYRFLTGMPEVTEDPTFDTDAQDCAIIQAANGLSHTPATTDTCYNATGAAASNRSSISSGQSVGSIDLYMDDSDNATGLNYGHRTWILANSLGPVGFGSVGTGGRTKTASCFYQVGGMGNAKVPYVGWPPGGPVPLQAFTATALDKSGWSLQSDSINLNMATATVMDGTTNQPVNVTADLPSYGAKYAMGIVPNGWTSQAGHNYTVTISGATTGNMATPIAYTVQVVDCSGYSTNNCGATDGGVSPTGTGGTTATTGAGGTSGPAGTGGAKTAGTGGAVGAGGAGGTTASGTGGSDATGAKNGSGCSCDATGDPAASLGGLAMVALLASFMRRRRRGST